MIAAWASSDRGKIEMNHEATTSALLELRDLVIEIARDGEVLRPVDGVDFEVGDGESVGVVGESGCGKSLTALSLLRLLPRNVARIASGTARFRGVDLFALSASELRKIRGRDIAMIFQEPMTSLNPVFPCGDQVAEGLREHLGLGRGEAFERAEALLAEVEIDHPSRRARQYPHELSGGMRQRVMIAMAIACGPRLLLADEPTTALDVTVQARILELLQKLQDERGMSILHITHDLGVVGEHAHRVLVMYSGRIVEDGPVEEILRTPAHPYTLGLLACRPTLVGRRSRLPLIGGAVPDPAHRPSGCAFHPRCPFATAQCAESTPPMRELGPGHRVACFEAERVRQDGRWPQ
jgi:oligopeptide/dipeptide ABC transporter ATP-binding protein